MATSKLHTKLPWLIILFSVCYIATMLVLSYLIDIQNMNVFGLKDWVAVKGVYETPIFWLHMFREGSLTENLQWAFLGAAVFLTAIIGIIQFKATRKVPWVWILLLIGLYVMFLEDIENIRHTTSAMIGSTYFGFDTSTMEWRTSSVRSAIEIAFYFILGSIMVTALVYILKDQGSRLLGKKFFLTGYFFYGTAAVFSATRNVGDWYAVVGAKAIDFVSRGAEISLPGDSYVYGRDPLGFWFMDFVVEESLEFIGAAFLLAALTVFITSIKKSPEPAVEKSELSEQEADTMKMS